MPVFWAIDASTRCLAADQVRLYACYVPFARQSFCALTTRAGPALGLECKDNQWLGGMELRQLRLFLRAAELKSISRAAMDLRIAQPALSRQIRSLEEELGVQLFVRDGRGVSLTEVGSILYEEVSAAMQRLDNACVTVREHQKIPSGVIRLGVLPNFGPSFTADLMLKFRQSFPRARLLLFEGFSYQIANWIQSKKIDLGFVYDATSYRNLSIEFVFREPGFLVGAPNGWTFGKSTPFSALANLGLITFAPPSNTKRRLLSAAAETATNLNFAYEMDSLAAIKRMVIQGHGVSIFSYATVWEEVAAGHLAATQLASPGIFYNLSLVSAFGAVLPAPARQTIEFLKQCVSAAAAENKWVGEFVSHAS
jgi:LysR family nitrogen assimilation transcriptional regulator